MASCFNTQPRGGGCGSSKTASEIFTQFQHTAARRRLLPAMSLFVFLARSFNTQPRGGGCLGRINDWRIKSLFQHTAARRRLPKSPHKAVKKGRVSTHSRAEAAATKPRDVRDDKNGFNTQPRGGGCKSSVSPKTLRMCFNTQPRGGGCIVK